MKQHPALSTLKPLVLFAAGAVFVSVAAGPARAQARTAAPPPQDLSMRETQIRSMELEGEHKSRPSDPNVLLAQVNDDLHRLQALHEQMPQPAAAEQPLDLKLICATTAEIKERAARLKLNLALPQGEKSEKRADNKEANNGQLQPGLSALDKLLDSFLHNPIFSDTGALDPQLAAKAKRDLDDILALSDKLRKSADKLNKASGKTP